MERSTGGGWKRGSIALVTCAIALVCAPAAWATASMSLSSDLSATPAVGKQGIAGTITVTNTSTSPQSSAGTSLTLVSLTLVPSCGQAPLAADCPASVRDPGVVSFNPNATGATGTACAGVPFTVTTTDAAQGKVEFDAASPVLLSNPSGPTPSCRVNFTFDILRMPTFDADPTTAGVQTGRLALATATHTDGSPAVTISPALSPAFARANVTASATPSGTTVNIPMTDAVTLTGRPSAPALTGTVSFKLYEPGDASCAGAPLFSSDVPVAGSGSYVSDPFLPVAPGDYHWLASYPGDANNAAVSTACQVVSVHVPIVATGAMARVGRVGATFAGSVDTAGAATTYSFEYGRTTAYGTTTPDRPVGGATGPASVMSIVTGLRAGTTYHYRLVATNGGGSITGFDATFKTKPKAALKRLSLSVTPHRDASAPYRFTFRGKLKLPAGLPPAQGCSGLISIAIRNGAKTLTTLRAGVTKHCGFAKAMTIPKGAGGARRLKVAVSFGGNRELAKKYVSTVIRTG
jgi:hypothetical protein